ncbi:cytochrome P450 [Daldinia vernicosa]|uniref:cytochrome P450 n=1 Tax=Daldinia vernicosa TaxID=114800 RepID=UPI0020077042|nr:cytochrome P450 [Daldinia vernicosa]KAI0854017.1 cytochrome P450 [Daldinia vernicosa]
MMGIQGVSLALLPVLSALILDFIYRLYRRRQRFKDLPKPPHSFLWGHLKLMGEIASQLPPNNHPQAYITAISQKYDLKGIWYLDLWPIADPQVILTEPELMDAVQVTRVYNQHRLSQEFMSSIIGENIVATVNGPMWKKLHNAMAPAFLPSYVRTLTGLMADETIIFREALKKLSSSRQVFSLENELSKLVFDIVGRVVFNFSLNAQTQGSSYHEDLKQTIELINQQLSMNPFVKLQVALKKRSVRKRVDASVAAKIQERLAALRSENIVPSRKDPLSILDLMLRETVLQGKTQNGLKALELPEGELELLVTNVKGLLLGGMGTSVDTLCYVYMLLSKHPEVVQKMLEEQDAVFGRDLETTMENLKESPIKLNELEYTTGVIKETMRLFPVGFGVKEAPAGATVSYQGREYPVDGGLVIVPSWHTMHFDSRYFPEPSAFRPERFLGEGVPRGWFRSFSRGPRACLGQDLAMDIMRVILLLTVRDFHFEVAGLRPNPKPKSTYTDLDTIFGDIVFQELSMEAKPRGGMMMTVSEKESAL